MIVSTSPMILSLGITLILRMLGIFMILPILSTYGMMLHDSSKMLIGLAIGIYGIMQAIFQIPFGYFSDIIGRKFLILTGLILFMIGSITAAASKSIWGIILGRAFQGSGAIASVIIALISDLTKEEHHTNMMAIIGVSFGITFAVAMVLGPIIAHNIGLNGLYWIVAITNLISVLLIFYTIPSDYKLFVNQELLKKDVKSIFLNKNLVKLNFSIMLLHSLLMSTFSVIPNKLQILGLSLKIHWRIYLFVMIFSFLFMIPILIIGELKKKIRLITLSCVSVLCISNFLFLESHSTLWKFLLALQLFFLSFNIMEAVLPTLVSRESPISLKGTSMGAYSTSQYIGVALGGLYGGWINSRLGPAYVYLINILITAFWLILIASMKSPYILRNLHLNLPGDLKKNIQNKIERNMYSFPGIQEVMLKEGISSVFIKYDIKKINKSQVQKLLTKMINDFHKTDL